MVPKGLEGVLVSSADTLGGAARFRGTRIHAKILFDYVLGGESLEDFLINYPDVRREAAQSLLDWERDRIAKSLDWEQAV